MGSFDKARRSWGKGQTIEQLQENTSRDSVGSSSWPPTFFRAYGHVEPTSPSSDDFPVSIDEHGQRIISMPQYSDAVEVETMPWWESARESARSSELQTQSRPISMTESQLFEGDRLSVLSEVLLSHWPPLSRLASNASARSRSYPSSIHRRPELPTPVMEQRHPGKEGAKLSRTTRRWEPDIPEEEEGPIGTPEAIVTNCDEGYLQGLPLILLLIGLSLVVLIISIDRTIITTGIPFITYEFQSTPDIGWYGSSYSLTACAFQLVFGRIFMLFDLKWPFLFSMFCFMLGSLLSGIAPSSGVLIVGRAIAGFGSAGVLTGSFMIVAVAVPLRPRPIYTAIVGLMFGLGAAAGPLIGGVFTDIVTWRWCFWTSLIVGSVTLCIVLLVLKTRRCRHANRTFIDRLLNLDIIGNLILIGACVMLFLALQYTAAGESWNNPKTVGLLCGSGITAIVFAVWQWWKQDAALIPSSVFTKRTVAASCSMSFFTYGALMIHIFFLPIWFQAVMGDTAIQSGIAMIPYFVANALFSLIAGVFVSKVGYAAPPAIIGSAIGTAGCGLISMFMPNMSTGMWVGLEILASAGFGLSTQQGFTAVQIVLAEDEIAIGTACVVASQLLGGAIFISVGNTVIQSRLSVLAASDNIPGFDVHEILHAGAAAFRQLLTGDELQLFLGEYSVALETVFIAAIPLAGLAFVSCFFMEWKSVKTKLKDSAA